MFETIGTQTVEAVREFGRAAALGLRVCRLAATSRPRRNVLVPILFEIGIRSLPVVLITGGFTGMVLAIQTYAQFQNLGMENRLGAVVCVAMVKELGPVLTALILAGRVGAAMTAELGTMKVTDQIDALRSMGTDPVGYLIVPRFIACVLLTPVLIAFSDTIGIMGGRVISVDLLNVDLYYFWHWADVYTDTYDIACGLVKGLFFGGFLAVICCYKGFYCGQGARGVGRATTQANVATCMAILVSNFFLAVVMYMVRKIFFAQTMV